jgi:ABC-type uncharacterized transport system permease subunit
MNTLLLLSIVAILLYLTSASLLGVRIVRGTQPISAGFGQLLIPGALAILFHAISLQQSIFSVNGINLGFFNALSLIAWIVVLVLLIGALFRPLINLAIVMFPGAAITVLLALLFPSERMLSTNNSWPLNAHILLSIFAYSLFALAAVQSIMLAIQDNHLRHHKPGGIVRMLPPLQTMETLLFQMILFGFILLSTALLTGAFYVENMFAQHLAHKTILSLLSWLVFGILLWGRWQHGWRGRKAIWWTLGGFMTLALSYFGVKFILEIVLQRSWG